MSIETGEVQLVVLFSIVECGEKLFNYTEFLYMPVRPLKKRSVLLPFIINSPFQFWHYDMSIETGEVQEAKVLNAHGKWNKKIKAKTLRLIGMIY